MRSVIVFAGLVIAALSIEAFADAESSRAELGKSIKLRILVDKVMQPEAKWVTQEWMVKAAADAGFNVLSPRAGYDRLDEVKQVEEWCKEYNAKRLYFDVPSGTDEFTLTIKGQGAETVRLNVFDPSDRHVATGQTTKNGQTVQVAVKPGDAAGRTCSLELTRADEGVLEDSSITIDAKLPPTLSLVPEHVFKLN